MPIGAGKYESDIKTIYQILLDTDMLGNYIPYPNPQNIKNISKTYKGLNNYFEIWKFNIDNMLYHFRLKDYSLIHFERNDKLSYRYFECAFDLPKDFADIGGEGGEEGETNDNINKYKYKKYPIAIRYDYDPAQYKEATHPASHLHIGINNNCRIGCLHIHTPISFFALVMRQQYPDKWKGFIVNNERFCHQLALDKMERIGKEHCSELDAKEHYLDNRPSERLSLSMYQ